MSNAAPRLSPAAFAAPLLLAALCGFPASPALAGALRLSGTVSCERRLPLADDRLEIVLVDHARQDVAAEPVRRLAFTPGRRDPVPFAMTVDTRELDPRGRYSLRATISAGGKLRCTTDSVNPVRPDLRRQTFDLRLRPAGNE